MAHELNEAECIKYLHGVIFSLNVSDSQILGLQLFKILGDFLSKLHISIPFLQLTLQA
jgi:hypothetical protein